MQSPPKLARWLLSHFGCSPNNDALVGDPDEQYQRGRSVIWYWLQILIAIPTSLGREVVAHKLRTLSALTVGWVSFIGFALLLLHRTLSNSPIFHVPTPETWSVVLAWDYVGRIFQADAWAFWRWLPMTCIASACSGCLVAVLNRTRGMLMVYFASRCVHTVAVCCYFAAAVIFVPQYASAFLLVMFGYTAALIVVIIPARLLTSGSHSQVRLKTR
jgi:hypothetical protein